jgi:hypothetical protein
MDATMVGR